MKGIIKASICLFATFSFQLFSSTAEAQSNPHSSIQVITDITVTPEGSHVIGGIPCPAGYSSVAGTADAGGGTPYGNQVICAKFERVGVNSGQMIVTDVMITPEGAHIVGGPGCQRGYESVGSFADCGRGSCFGNQNLCIKRQRLVSYNNASTWILPLVDIFVTPLGAHLVGGFKCPRGFQQMGSVADCGNGQCYGNQVFCKRN